MSMDLTAVLAENDRLAGTHFAGLIDRIKQQRPNVPIVCVLVSGRPLVIGPQLSASSAFVAAWYPGSEGRGVAEVLYGDYPFAGKLSHTWPASFGQIPINTDPQAGEQAGSGGTAQFTYGFGLNF
jgi:beta-glucosidase